MGASAVGAEPEGGSDTAPPSPYNHIAAIKSGAVSANQQRLALPLSQTVQERQRERQKHEDESRDNEISESR